MEGIPVEYLYTAFRLDVSFSNGTEIRNSQGTGFFIQNNEVLFLVTNRHVVDPQWDQPGKSINLNKYRGYSLHDLVCIGRPSGDQIRKFKLIDHQMCYTDLYTDDVAVMRLDRIEHLDGLGQIVLDHFISSTDVAISSKFDGKSEGINVCDQIAFPTYGSEFSGSLERPAFRIGWLASDPRRSLDLPDVVGDAFLTEAFSMAGSSGAPVFALPKGFRIATEGAISFFGKSFREGCLIGVNAGHIKSADHGHANLSYAFKSNVILTCMKSAGALIFTT